MSLKLWSCHELWIHSSVTIRHTRKQKHYAQVNEPNQAKANSMVKIAVAMQRYKGNWEKIIASNSVSNSNTTI